MLISLVLAPARPTPHQLQLHRHQPVLPVLLSQPSLEYLLDGAMEVVMLMAVLWVVSLASYNLRAKQTLWRVVSQLAQALAIQLLEWNFPHSVSATMSYIMELRLPLIVTVAWHAVVL